MSDTTDSMTVEQAAEALTAPEQTTEAPETTEVDELQVGDPDEAEVEASGEDTTETDDEAEAESDYADVAEADKEDATEDEAADDDDDAGPELIPVKANGKEELKTLDELKQAYAGQAKIQQDMQTNAQARKQLEAAAAALMDQQRSLLEMHQNAQQRGFKPPPQAPDPALIDSEPQEYMRQRAQYEKAVGEFQQEQAQLTRYQQQQEAWAEAQRAKMQAEQFEVLKSRIPEMADEKTAPDYARKLLEVGTEYRFSTEELSNIDDPRALEVLNDAMKWRNLERQRKASKVQPKPTRSVKAKAASGANAGAKAKKAQERLSKTGSIDDAVSILLGR